MDELLLTGLAEGSLPFLVSEADGFGSAATTRSLLDWRDPIPNQLDELDHRGLSDQRELWPVSPTMTTMLAIT